LLRRTFCLPWVCRSRALAPLFDSHSVSKQRRTKSREPETRCEKLLIAWKRERARMPLLRQLEFAFHTVAVSLSDAPRFAQRSGYRTVDLETKARELLRSLGAAPMANELRVEWNSRLKTAAGRADYRHKLISLNPRLFEQPAEIDRTLRHELAHLLRLLLFFSPRNFASCHVEQSRDISRYFGDKYLEIELVRLPPHSPLPSRLRRPCRSSQSLHSSTPLGITKD